MANDYHDLNSGVITVKTSEQGYVGNVIGGDNTTALQVESVIRRIGIDAVQTINNKKDSYVSERDSLLYKYNVFANTIEQASESLIDSLDQ